MSSRDRDKFFIWYKQRIEEGGEFDLKKEMTDYCKQDVQILRLACVVFRNMYFHEFKVEPFIECTTIASTCMRVFRKNFLKENQIGLIGNGYRLVDKSSPKALQWILWMEEKILNRPIQHALRSREKRTLMGFPVDGFCKPLENEKHLGIVLNFHGCFYHGCIKTFKTNRDRPLFTGDSMDTRLDSTRRIAEKIRNANYRLIEMWKCDFDKQVEQDDELRCFIEERDEIIRMKPLDPRMAFYGGRTNNNIKFYECGANERIRYYDVCSLYPYIQKKKVFPIKHPDIYVGQKECASIVGDNNDISRVSGLIMCDVLPPQNLYHGLLPLKLHSKILFPLCRKCAEEKYQEECPHLDIKDRKIHGTWVSLELQQAVKLGYKVLRVYEI